VSDQFVNIPAHHGIAAGKGKIDYPQILRLVNDPLELFRAQLTPFAVHLVFPAAVNTVGLATIGHRHRRRGRCLQIEIHVLDPGHDGSNPGRRREGGIVEGVGIGAVDLADHLVVVEPLAKKLDHGLIKATKRTPGPAYNLAVHQSCLQIRGKKPKSEFSKRETEERKISFHSPLLKLVLKRNHKERCLCGRK